MVSKANAESGQAVDAPTREGAEPVDMPAVEALTVASGEPCAEAPSVPAEAAVELVVMPGAIVHYVLGADGIGIGRPGEVRPAIVVKAWEGSSPPLVQLQVFHDGTNDDPYEGRATSWRSSVPYAAAPADGSPLVVGTWHWPYEGWGR